jgi:phosphopentomutase
MEKRVFLFVFDGFGVGASEDANLFGDEGSNSFENTNNLFEMNIPTLTKLGIKNIDGLHFKKEEKVIGSFGKLRELSKGKDTTTGHFEMMGIINSVGMPTFPNGFPKEIVEKLEKAFGTKIIGNCVASGTQIIQELGAEHKKTGCPIVYTSADSVLQIACDVDVVPLQKLYEYCEKARQIMCGKYAVGRVIARPFMEIDGKFERLNNDRRDFALIPDKNNTMQRLCDAKKDVISVGKISDIFAHQSITKDYPSHNNKDALASTKILLDEDFNGLAFINLVDTDMLYGHRNNPEGYAHCIEATDKFLSEFIKNMRKDDVLIVTGDHGNDPTTISTDHSREFTPLLVYGKNIKQNVNLETLDGFNQIGKFVEEYLIGEKNSAVGEMVWKK